MARTKFKPSKFTLFLGLILTGSIILFVPQNITSRLNFAFIDIFRFFLNVGSSAVYYQPGQNISPDYVPRHEYDKLWVAYSNLQAEIFAQRQQIEKLGKIRMSESDPATGFVIAKIVNRRKDEFFINKGTNDGLRNGQYVLGDSAVIGYIKQASPDISSVLLITSSACRMPIKIAAPRANAYFNGTIIGNDKDAAKIPNLRKTYPLQEGCSVYADSKTNSLQSPRIIGRVSKCLTDQSNPVLWDITVEPAYKFDNLNDVAVIVIRIETE